MYKIIIKKVMTPTKKRKEKVIFYWSIECLIYLSYDIKILIKAQKFNKKLFLNIILFSNVQHFTNMFYNVCSSLRL